MLLVVEGPMNRARAAGFSLIELLIVVGFVSVLAAMSGPPIQAGMARYALLSASQGVAGTIRTARFQAVARNQILRVRFTIRPPDSIVSWMRQTARLATCRCCPPPPRSAVSVATSKSTRRGKSRR